MSINSKKPWSGRFKEQPHPIVETFTSSVHFDTRLYKYDIAGSIAHARMLARQGVLSRQESSKIIMGLNQVRDEIASGIFKPSPELEDIHMNIESRLIKKVGNVGKKLHTARSRNDQVCFDIKLYLRDEIINIQRLIRTLQRAIVTVCKRYKDAILPGYTHLQRAQPVLLSHHLLAYFEMLHRDWERFDSAYKAADIMPLGAGAIAGTSLPIDREYVAKLTGFRQITINSMDSVSDRDFALDFLYACAVLMMHISRLSEEFILWTTSEFNFAELPDSFATGSSMMPNKKNPDVLELIRGKSGRAYGNLLRLLTVMKGLPLTYNRDMQEDKEAIFDSSDTIKSSLEILAELFPRVKFDPNTMEKACNGFLTATDIAEYLVGKGIPFREAHSIAGSIVRYCIDKKKTLSDLSNDELKEFSELLDKGAIRMLSPHASVNIKTSAGGTSKKNVNKQILRAELILKHSKK